MPKKIPVQVLIVDDEKTWRKTLRKIVKRMKYQYKCVNSLKAARDELAKGRFAIVITDIFLTEEKDAKVAQGLWLLDDIAPMKQAYGRPVGIVVSGYPLDGPRQIQQVVALRARSILIDFVPKTENVGKLLSEAIRKAHAELVMSGGLDLPSGEDLDGEDPE